eukprot:1053454-Amphidinium_carterae.1
MYAFWKSMTVGATGLMAIMSTDVKPGDGYESAYPMFRLLLDVILGAICGTLGGLWVKMHSYVMGTMKRWRTSSASPRPELQKTTRRTKIGFDLNESLLGNAAERGKSWAVDSTTDAGPSRWNVKRRFENWSVAKLDFRLECKKQPLLFHHKKGLISGCSSCSREYTACGVLSSLARQTSAVVAVHSVLKGVIRTGGTLDACDVDACLDTRCMSAGQVVRRWEQNPHRRQILHPKFPDHK